MRKRAEDHTLFLWHRICKGQLPHTTGAVTLQLPLVSFAGSLTAEKTIIQVP